MMRESDHKILVGWREWVDLPNLGLEHIKAKIDTGARTSALHAFEVEVFTDKGQHFVRFRMHPVQKRKDIVEECISEVVDTRWVSDSGGHREKRVVIVTDVSLGGLIWPVEMTLTNRDTMQFRMLLGRTAMENRIVVDPSASFLLGRRKTKK